MNAATYLLAQSTLSEVVDYLEVIQDLCRESGDQGLADDVDDSISDINYLSRKIERARDAN